MTAYKNPILEIISEAQRAMPYHAHHTPGIDEPRFLPKKAASLRTLTLNKTSVRVDKSGKIIVGGQSNLAGEEISIERAIFSGSRFAGVGGNLIFLPEHSQPVETGLTGAVSMRQEPVSFSVVSPATLEEVTDDAEVSTSTLPVFVETIDRAGQKSYGVSFKLSRADQKSRGEQTAANELLCSIVTGLSRVVDKLAIEAILATAPKAFSLAKAAAAGVRFRELRALVGTDANGAFVGADDQLKAGRFDLNGWQASGITAELTDVTAKTVIGDFSKAAAVLGPDMTILVSRLNTVGDVHVTAWLSADAVCPAAGKFWTVEAA